MFKFTYLTLECNKTIDNVYNVKMHKAKELNSHRPFVEQVCFLRYYLDMLIRKYKRNKLSYKDLKCLEKKVINIYLYLLIFSIQKQ